MGETEPEVAIIAGPVTDAKRLSFWGLLKELFNWYPVEYPPEERKLLFKMDLSILIFACLCFFVKFLDQTNISNAYVSGLKEDFALYGNELNYFNTCYYAAYVAFQIPGLLLLSRPKMARFLLPSLEIIWGILTFAQSRVTNAKQLYALRFLVGMFEAPVFAGTHFILGSWYSGPELFKRAGTWFLCSSLGTIVSGYIQAAAYTNLAGVAGLPGWRWLFVIDGIFTIPVAIIGFIDDTEERALIMGSMMTFGYSFQIWVPILLYPTAGPYGAPRWQRGWPVTLAFWILLYLAFVRAVFLHWRDVKSSQSSSQVTGSEGSASEEAEGVDFLTEEPKGFSLNPVKIS